MNLYRSAAVAVAVLILCAYLLVPTAKADRPPVIRAEVFNGAAPGVDTAILATDITPVNQAVALRVTVALTTGSVLNVTATDGTTTHKWGLNSSTALNAGDLYTFSLGATSSLNYNFEVETDGVIEYLLVEEIQDGTL